MSNEQTLAFDKLEEFQKVGPVEDNYFALRGKAGTGKTYVLAQFVKKNRKKSVCVAAVAHKAKREIFRRCKADNVTPLSLAGLLDMRLNLETGEFTDEWMPSDKEPTIEQFDIIIIDEGSMIPGVIVQKLMDRKNPDTVLIFAGDEGQIRPIEKEGRSRLGALSPSLVSPYGASLVTRVRQGEGHPILEDSDIWWNTTKSLKPVLQGLNRSNKEIEGVGKIVYTDFMRYVLDELTPVFRRAVEHNEPGLAKVVTFTNAKKKRINAAVRERIYGKPDTELEDYMPNELVIMEDNYRVPKIDMDLDIFGTLFDQRFTNADNSDEFSVTETIPGVWNFKNVPEEVDIQTSWDIYYLKGTAREIEDGEEFEIEYFLPVINPNQHKDYYAMVNKVLTWAKTLPKNSKQRTKGFMLYEMVKQCLPKINYGYAITAHKSQGSTYETSVVDLTDMFTSRSNAQEIASLVYTGMTRASKNCYMVHDKYPRTVHELQPVLVEI